MSGNALITIEYDVKDDESQFNCILHNRSSNTIENRNRKSLPNRFWQPCPLQSTRQFQPPVKITSRSCSFFTVLTDSTSYEQPFLASCYYHTTIISTSLRLPDGIKECLKQGRIYVANEYPTVVRTMLIVCQKQRISRQITLHRRPVCFD